MKSYHFFIIIMIFLLFYNSNINIENYINSYQNNKTLSNEPDDKQFYFCSHSKFKNDIDYPFEEYPNSNYKVKINSIKKPLKGTFSSFIDIHKLRSYDHFYHAPICEDTYSFNNNIRSQFRSIIQADDDISLLLEEEKNKDSYGLNNPYFLYGNPQFIQNKILYDNDIQKNFLDIKLGSPKHHEDDKHLIHDHNYDIL